MINEMALKMKRDREEAKRKGATTYSYSYGGFLGVEKLTRGSANVAQPSPKPSRSNPKVSCNVVSKVMPIFYDGTLYQIIHIYS